MKGEPGDQAYARAIERALAILDGRSVLLSPRDWARVSGWRRAGVPLGIVLEELERVARSGSGRARSALAYIAPAVEDAWRAVREGRASSLGDAAPAHLSFAAGSERWKRAAAREVAGSCLGDLLHEIVGRLEHRENPLLLDSELDRRLVEAVPAALRTRAQSQVTARFAHARGRLRAGEEAAAMARALVDTLREHLDLPRLSLCEDKPGPAPKRRPRGAASRI